MPEYVFQNLEDPKLLVTTFHVDGEYYTLPRNGIVQVPEHVADHLNALTYPDYMEGIDPVTGESMSQIIPGRRRFSLIPHKREKLAKGN